MKPLLEMQAILHSSELSTLSSDAMDLGASVRSSGAPERPLRSRPPKDGGEDVEDDGELSVEVPKGGGRWGLRSSAHARPAEATRAHASEKHRRRRGSAAATATETDDQ